VEAAAPWLELALTRNGQGNDVIEQVQVLMDVLKVLRSHSSATYVEDGVVVTHGETVIRDVK
jgi:hypothetical protein